MQYYRTYGGSLLLKISKKIDAMDRIIILIKPLLRYTYVNCVMYSCYAMIYVDKNNNIFVEKIQLIKFSIKTRFYNAKRI